ncbi:hypothetical protein BHM03_00014564 [Ensete ventricosum]|nr:hypothetical protein BHM03_00014564 [Ensete ventricosum]
MSAAPILSNASILYVGGLHRWGTARWGSAIRHSKTGRLRSPDSPADRSYRGRCLLVADSFVLRPRPSLACAAQPSSFLPPHGISRIILVRTRPLGNTTSLPACCCTEMVPSATGRHRRWTGTWLSSSLSWGVRNQDSNGRINGNTKHLDSSSENSSIFSSQARRRYHTIPATPLLLDGSTSPSVLSRLSTHAIVRACDECHP